MRTRAQESISGCEALLDVAMLRQALRVEVAPEHRGSIVVLCEGDAIAIHTANASTRLEAGAIPRIARPRWVALSAARLSEAEQIRESEPVQEESAEPVEAEETDSTEAELVETEAEDTDSTEAEPVDLDPVESDPELATVSVEGSEEPDARLGESPFEERTARGLQGEVHLGSGIAFSGNPLSLRASAGAFWAFDSADSLRFALGLRADFRYARHSSALGEVRAFPLGLLGVAELRGPERLLSWVVDVAAGLRLLLVRTRANESVRARDLTLPGLGLHARAGLQVRLSPKLALSLLAGVEGDVGGFVAITDEGDALDLQGPRLTLQVGLRF